MIPQGLSNWLHDSPHRTFEMTEGEVRKAVFHELDRVTLKAFEVDSYELFLNGPLEVDPEETRVYSGYDLVESAGSYEAEGIFIWFPDWQAYGAWDSDHHRIITFPGAIWVDISADPTWYINGQWYPHKVNHREINPWTES